MKNYPFTLTTKLLENIYDYYKRCLESENEDRSNEYKTPLISKESFESLLQTAFWASLLREEGVFHSFDLTIFPKPSDETQEFAESYIFEKSIPFTSKNLAKLSWALESTNNKIGVWLNNEIFEIWGFTEHSGSFFEIKSFDAGQLIISFPLSLQSQNPKKQLLTGTELRFLSNSLSEKIRNFLLQKKDVLNYSIQEDFLTFLTNRLFGIEYFQIAKLMREHGHGGILLIVPSNDKWKESMKNFGFNTPNAFKKVKKSIQIFDQTWKNETSHNPSFNFGRFWNIFPSDEEKIQQYEKMKIQNAREDARKGLEKYLALISQLTAIDGATVIGYDFSVFAFGAKIKSSRNESLENTQEIKYVEIFPFENDSEIKKSKSISEYRKGTRHLSTVQFVFDNPDSLGIVVSQDGQISFIFKENDTIQIYPNSEFIFS